MADPKRIPVLDPEGRFGTVDESELDQLPEGARVLTKQEQAQKAVDDRYDALPTVNKVAGAVNTAAAAALGPAGLLLHSDPYAPHDVLGTDPAAFGAGVREGLTAGVSDAVTRTAIDAFGGKAAGDRYAQQVDDVAEASPWSHGAGSAAGMLAGAAAGGESAIAKMLPSAGIGALGAPIEKGVERALGGLAARGALGRAATTAAGMAARGALEGTAFAGIQQTASDITHDDPATGKKYYAAMGHGALLGGGLGGVLGFTGSLGATGLRAARTKIASSIIGSLEKAPSAVEGVPHAEPVAAGAHVDPYAEWAAQAQKDARGAAGLPDPIEAAPAERAPAARASAEAPPAPGPSVASAAATKLANEQAFRAVGGGFGLQSTRYAKEAAKYFPGGTADLGEVALRYGAIDMGGPNANPWQAAVAAAKGGTPTEIAPKLAAAEAKVGARIGEITDQSGARIHVNDIEKVFGRVRAEPERIAGNEHVVNAIDSYRDSLRSKLRVAPDGTVSVQDLLEQRKGLDAIVYQETKTLDPGRRVAALRSVRSGIEDVITEALDNASGRVPGELRAEYKALKKDYHALRILNEAAEDSAARAAKGASFGLGEKFAVGAAVASGHFASAPVLALGGKVLRERGNAAAAAFIAKSVQQGHVDAVMKAWSDRVKKAAGGVLREAETGPSARSRSSSQERKSAEQGRADVRDAQEKAVAITRWVADTKGNPARLQQALSDAAAQLGESAGPRAAEGYTAATIQALAFISRYVPQRERRDPFDPRSVPAPTYEEADRLIRATKYATRPETILADFERGVITPEGLAARQVFIGDDDWLKFQIELQDHALQHIRRNKQLTQSQRLRLDKLLPYPAGADLRPAAIAAIQDSLSKKPAPGGPSANLTGGGGPPPAPVDLQVQQTGFDAVEARLAG